MKLNFSDNNQAKQQIEKADQAVKRLYDLGFNASKAPVSASKVTTDQMFKDAQTARDVLEQLLDLLS